MDGEAGGAEDGGASGKLPALDVGFIGTHSGQNLSRSSGERRQGEEIAANE